MLGFRSKYSKFWNWFQRHEDELFRFEEDQESIFDKLAAQIRQVHRDLCFEFSSVKEGQREFTVSAGGIKEAFPEVTALVSGAPKLPRWQILAFRQHQDIPSISFGGRMLNREAVSFDYVETGDKLDVTVFLPGLREDSDTNHTALKTIGYLFLDATLGEYLVETKLAGIEFVDASAFPGRRRLPLPELQTVIDKLPASIQ
jgi:hypothetical protein